MPGMSDPYHDAAFLHILLMCDHCDATLNSDELSGVPTFPADGWDIALGDAARERGWIIQYDESAIGLSIACPSCATQRRHTSTFS
jgi:hypothetical protein